MNMGRFYFSHDRVGGIIDTLLLNESQSLFGTWSQFGKALDTTAHLQSAIGAKVDVHPNGLLGIGSTWSSGMRLCRWTYPPTSQEGRGSAWIEDRWLKPHAAIVIVATSHCRSRFLPFASLCF